MHTALIMARQVGRRTRLRVLCLSYPPRTRYDRRCFMYADGRATHNTRASLHRRAGATPKPRCSPVQECRVVSITSACKLDKVKAVTPKGGSLALPAHCGVAVCAMRHHASAGRRVRPRLAPRRCVGPSGTGLVPDTAAARAQGVQVPLLCLTPPTRARLQTSSITKPTAVKRRR